MRIKIERKPFWLWLLQLSYRRLKLTCEKLPNGIPGIRDVENPCTGYAPRKRNACDYPAECGSDGHYLCKGCAFYNSENDLSVTNETKN